MCIYVWACMCDMCAYMCACLWGLTWVYVYIMYMCEYMCAQAMAKVDHMCVAVCCSVLQCVAVCCSVLQCEVLLQCVAVCCSVLQCLPVCCGVIQCVAVCGNLNFFCRGMQASVNVPKRRFTIMLLKQRAVALLQPHQFGN